MTEATLGRMISALQDLREDVARLERRVHTWELWAQTDGLDFPRAGTRLSELESKLVIDRQAIVARLVAEIRADPGLRELLRGPRGLPGLDGEKGPPGDAGSTVIREQRIVG